ncbi:MAG: decaprenyl-phosphate phosphoribosyltransferase [Ignavibacteriales bacterium]|nr:decaprenyl-phosphate phosphoribosyltransferase [Ignavibacteriales bacterium]
MKAFLILLRPKQWVKNLFLFAPLIFSQHLFEEGYFATAVLGFAAFCLLSSGVYVINDIFDREADKRHPLKRQRPIAAGAVSPGAGFVFAAVLLALAALLSSALNDSFRLTAGLYLVLNLAYSFRLKQLILIDVFIIAAGFMLRVLAGAFVIDVEVSHWLVLCTLFVSLFLALSKRRGELLLARETGEASGREVLKEYDTAFADQMITISASGMAISYALYTVAERTVTIFKTENLIFTTVFVLFGIFRYLYLLKKRSTEDNPTMLLITDPVMMVNVAAWFVACVVIIYSKELQRWF